MSDKVLTVRLWPILGYLRKWPFRQGNHPSCDLDTSLQFSPVIGRIVYDAIEGKLNPAASQRRADDRKVNLIPLTCLNYRIDT